ncbi:TIGR02646 family protein [Flexibacter flexilis DSM 6793]|uniref:TIGR02646 family protein n=1 Tax=Flexibacter flexilis DSM 6793 TaxID=927664 RepID=A0A1I1G8R4_9BACT|nr:hypothetical protein [Flexibacter flexilis]SFC05753.1 TIGR02646 family protein [Flexibacter flexilis DSM 6793]
MVYHEKTQPEPPCLAAERAKKKGTYNCEGVVTQLKADFKNKCYICEQKEPTSINIEHFKSRKGDKNLRLDWNNLFYCCGHCNNTKLAKTIYDSILNCTIKEHGVDTRIKYEIKPFPKEKALITALEDTPEVQNTAHLLNAVYNGIDTEQKQIEAANLRSDLLKEIKLFGDLLFDFDDDTLDSDEKERVKGIIIRHLRSSSKFTAFKRWIIRDNEVLKADFKEYI